MYKYMGEIGNNNFEVIFFIILIKEYFNGVINYFFMYINNLCIYMKCFLLVILIEKL